MRSMFITYEWTCPIYLDEVIGIPTCTHKMHEIFLYFFSVPITICLKQMLKDFKLHWPFICNRSTLDDTKSKEILWTIRVAKRELFVGHNKGREEPDRRAIPFFQHIFGSFLFEGEYQQIHMNWFGIVDRVPAFGMEGRRYDSTKDYTPHHDIS